MVGTYDEVQIRVRRRIFPEIRSEVRLQPQLNAEAQFDHVLVFFLHRKIFSAVSGVVQLECAGAYVRIIIIRKLRVIVVREAHVLQSLLNSRKDLRLHGGGAVA